MSNLNGRVIALSQIKGGSGKTTLALHLARAFELAGQNVALHDLDPQGSALRFQNALPGVAWHAWGTAPKRDAGRLLILDVPGALGPEMGAALKLADVIVAPVNSNAAYESLEPFGAIVAQAQGVNPRLRLLIAPVMVMARSSHWAELEPRMRREMSGQVLAATIPRTSAFENAQRERKTLFEYAPRHAANTRLRELAQEIQAQVLSGDR